jgi:phosphoribosylamine--glycine ligase
MAAMGGVDGGVPAGLPAGLKVLVIGGGGREHAIAWALGHSARVREVVVAPGNGGIAGAQTGAGSRTATTRAATRCVAVDVTDVEAMVQLAVAEAPELTVIGPEVPLALGVVDALQRRGLRVFGPTQAAAELETSKAFAKRFMQRHSIPTAQYAVCGSKAEALASLDLFASAVATGGTSAVVVKADGLHAGKGVLLCTDRAEAEAAITGLFSGELLGKPETQVVLEELLEGDELSFLIMSDGRHVAPLLPAQDHKRIGEGDTGLNTGGMGVYTADTMLAAPMQEWIVRHIAQPTIDGMAAEGTPFVGVLFIGLMMTARGPMVLEYNTRFGDPETQAILVRLESDLCEAFDACVDGRLSDTEFRGTPGASACVIAASGGYPGAYRTGLPMEGLENVGAEAVVFHAGTTLEGGVYRTGGGRVLGVTAAAETLEQALAKAYAGMSAVHFEGMYYRRDIGHRGLRADGRERAKQGNPKGSAE